MRRNLSVNAYFRHMAAKHKPRYRFAGSSREDWKAWRDGLYEAVVASLGKMPEKVPDTYFSRRWAKLSAPSMFWRT